jgi:hypothetical protein
LNKDLSLSWAFRWASPLAPFIAPNSTTGWAFHIGWHCSCNTLSGFTCPLAVLLAPDWRTFFALHARWDCCSLLSIALSSWLPDANLRWARDFLSGFVANCLLSSLNSGL